MIKMNTEGTVTDVSCEALSLIRSIYKTLARDNIEVAKQFKHKILAGLAACFMTDEELKQRVAEMDRELDNFINDLSKKTFEERAEDIRSADFKSDKDFMNWLHGNYGSDEEEEES